MHIGILGINHKSAHLPLREKLAKVCSHLFGAEQRIYAHFSFVLLSTCNRTEIYFSSDNLAETHAYILNALRSEIREEFEHCIYTYFGSDCFSHLAKVTSGIDSALIGETEIQGQVKRAYTWALSLRPLAPELHFLFQKSLKIGKNIRSSTQLTQKALSIDEAILNATTDQLGLLEKQNTLFVGLSEINCHIFYRLKEVGLHSMTLCNRTDEKAKKFAEKEDAAYLKWSDLGRWIDFDLIIFGTKCPHFLADHRQLNKGISHKLLIDLSVPRNVDPKLGRHPNITLLNIDQLNYMLNRKQKLKAQELARIGTQLIAQAIERQSSLFKHREHHRSPLFAQVS